MGDNMGLNNIVAIDYDGNEIELGKGITEIKSENLYLGIDTGDKDFCAEGTLTIGIKNKKITKRKMIKLFMSEGFDRNTAIRLYKLYLCKTSGKRTTLGYMIFRAMCAVRGYDGR